MLSPRTVTHLVQGRATLDGAGVHLCRTLGGPVLEQHDPFLLLDEFHSTDPNEYIAGFPDHPHRGFETVTYMLAGRMQHRDSVGNHGELGPGDLQWMTAGRGIIHSEMPLQEQGEMRGFQLWVNLPSTHKMVPPRYQDIPAKHVPLVLFGEAEIRVLAGEIEGVTGPVTGVQMEPSLFDVMLPPDAHVELKLPEEDHGFAYAFEGSGQLGKGSTAIHRQQLATFEQGGPLKIEAGPEGIRLLIGSARPIGEEVARYGPFVMNTRTEIGQAIEDYRAGRLDRL